MNLKKDERPRQQKSRFLITSKGVFGHLTIKKSLKTIFTEYVPDVRFIIS